MYSTQVKLEYGIRDDKVLNITELNIDEKGNACNCYCPQCGGALIAKMGEKNKWHFAHRGTACDIIKAQQTAAHMLAKEIIESKKSLLFPGYTANKNDYIEGIADNRIINLIVDSFEITTPDIYDCSTVYLENRVDDIIPDIVTRVKDRVCLIEIAVTHPIDNKKLQKIREIGYPLFEIDLRDFHKKKFTREELEKAVLYEENNRKWIYNPKAEQIAREKYLEEIHDAEVELVRICQEIRSQEVPEKSEFKIGDKIKCGLCNEYFDKYDMVAYGGPLEDFNICRSCSKRLE